MPDATCLTVRVFAFALALACFCFLLILCAPRAGVYRMAQCRKAFREHHAQQAAAGLVEVLGHLDQVAATRALDEIVKRLCIANVVSVTSDLAGTVHFSTVQGQAEVARSSRGHALARGKQSREFIDAIKNLAERPDMFFSDSDVLDSLELRASTLFTHVPVVFWRVVPRSPAPAPAPAPALPPAP
jgi:hypothetical protein